MPKQTPTLNQADINALKEVFATKDDLRPLKKDIKYIKKSLNLLIEDFEPQIRGNTKRISNIESRLSISSP